MSEKMVPDALQKVALELKEMEGLYRQLGQSNPEILKLFQFAQRSYQYMAESGKTDTGSLQLFQACKDQLHQIIRGESMEVQQKYAQICSEYKESGMSSQSLTTLFSQVNLWYRLAIQGHAGAIDQFNKACDQFYKELRKAS